MGRRPRRPIPITVPEKKPKGCPLTEIDWDIVDGLLRAGCHGTEIAPHFAIHEDTLYRRCEEKFGMTFSAYSRQKKSIGEANLRAKQYNVAMAGNTTLLIWLGKQRLGQTEKSKEEAFSLEDLRSFLSQIAKGVSSLTESQQPNLATQQPLLHQDTPREQSSIPNELGSEGTL